MSLYEVPRNDHTTPGTLDAVAFVTIYILIVRIHRCNTVVGKRFFAGLRYCFDAALDWSWLLVGRLWCVLCSHSVLRPESKAR